MSNTFDAYRCAKCSTWQLVPWFGGDGTEPELKTFRCYHCRTINDVPEYAYEPIAVAEEQDHADTEGKPLPA